MKSVRVELSGHTYFLEKLVDIAKDVAEIVNFLPGDNAIPYFFNVLQIVYEVYTNAREIERIDYEYDLKAGHVFYIRYRDGKVNKFTIWWSYTGLAKKVHELLNKVLIFAREYR